MRKLPTNLAENNEAVTAERRRLRAESRLLVEEWRQIRAYSRWVIDAIRRQHQPDYHQALQAAIQVMHGCRSVHLASFAVRKVSDGRIVWEGIVEEFRLIGHAQAETCYAWHHPAGSRRERFSLLKSALVNSPQRAVQLALAAPGGLLAKRGGTGQGAPSLSEA